MSEIVYCKLCRTDFEALDNEIASYMCPNCSKSKSKIKILDHVSFKYLTELNGSDETLSPKPKNISSNDVKRETHEP